MLFNNFGREETVTENSELTLEDQSLIMEAAILDTLTDEEIESFLENHQEVTAAIDGDVLTEKTIVRLDKKAKLSHAQTMAVFAIAKEKNDPKLKKLITIWRLERALEQDLMRKYGSEGMRRAKQAMNAPAKSKSSMMRKVAKNVNSSFNSIKSNHV